MCFSDISIVVVGGTSTGPISSIDLSTGTVSSVSLGGGIPSTVSSVEVSNTGLVTPISMGEGMSIVGPQGPKGETGAAGKTGDKGDKGDKGDTGERGATGDKGDKGDAGERGATGGTGATGPQGVTGATGPQGVTGATGPQGVTGSQGATGAQGVTGATGSQGETGAQGATGFRGETGNSGITGFFGVNYLFQSGVTGVGGSVGRFYGNYANNTPNSGDSQRLYISATDSSNINRINYWNFGRDNQTTGYSECGHLFVSSYDREMTSVYTIGSITRVGSSTSATAFFTFNWLTTSATGGTFNDGERFGLFYVPIGRIGAQGPAGSDATISIIDGGDLRNAVP